MYIVTWCDHEGNQRERPCYTLNEAKIEAEELRNRFGGPVEIKKVPDLR